MADRPLRIVLADDAADLRSLVRARLGIAGGFDVVGEAADGAEVIEVARATAPDVVLLDVSMPNVDGLAAIAPLQAACPGVIIVMFTGFDHEGLAERAEALGAHAFIEKSVPLDELPDRIRAAAEGRAQHAHPIAPEEVIGAHVERFRAAFDQAAIGMATLTLTGRVVRANRALQRTLQRDGLVGLTYGELAGPGREAITAAVDTVAGGGQDVVSVEHRVSDRQWVQSTVTAVRGDDGLPVYLLLQVQDVSARREAEQQFRLLVESVADYAIFMLDPTGHIATWNRGAERIKGYRADEIIGQHFRIFYTEDAKARRHPEHELEVASAEGRYEEDGWRIRKDGSEFWANVVITALRDAAGELRGFAKVTRDFTERMRAAEDLRTANETLARVAAERTQFLAVTAHELRTPVTVVNGFATTLRDHWEHLPDKDRVDMINALSRGGERLARLVDELLTASRLEAGALEVHPSSFDLGDLVREVTAEVTTAGGAEITIDVSSCTVFADRGRVQQMLANYLTNALRYGGGGVVVRAHSSAGAVEVHVDDSGPGVPEHILPRLFGKFVRGASDQGTGLGLFIVRELARAQGGDAWYEDREGGGASFALRLPSPR